MRSPGGSGGGSGFVIARDRIRFARPRRYTFRLWTRLSVDTRVPGVALVSLIGEHELYGAPKLQERIDSLIAERPVDRHRPDGHACFSTRRSSASCSKEQKLAASSGVDYTVVLSKSTGEPVRRMFEITGLARDSPDRRARRRPAAELDLARRPRRSRRPGLGFRSAEAHLERRARLGRHRPAQPGAPAEPFYSMVNRSAGSPSPAERP